MNEIFPMEKSFLLENDVIWMEMDIYLNKTN